MEQFIISARKYRPTAFEEVIGQRQVTETLLHEINSNQLAQAFLFTGPRGVGKTTCARILAKVINAKDGGDVNQDYAFNIFELDAASNNSVEDIRHLIDQVRIPPQIGKYKVYIIDEVHMLSAQAFNAFLKTLEEPPSYAIFILATTEKYKILPTILSRCQVFNFNRIQIRDMVEHLKGISVKENIEASEDALHLIASKADGGLRDALSMFDQLVSFGGGRIDYESAVEILSVVDLSTYFEITSLLSQSNISDALMLYDTSVSRGFDGATFLGGLSCHLRNLVVSKQLKTRVLLDVSESFKSKYVEQSGQLSFSFILNGLNLVCETEEKYKSSRNTRLLVELCLMKLGQLNSFIQHIPSLEDVKKKLIHQSPDVLVKGNVFMPHANVKPIPASSILAPYIVEEKSKTESTRQQSSGFSQFKEKREKDILASSAKQYDNEIGGDELGFQSPNLNESIAPTHALTPSDNQAEKSVAKPIQEIWTEFCQSQRPRIATCLKNLDVELCNGLFVVRLNANNQEDIVEEIRTSLMGSLRLHYPSTIIRNITTVMEEKVLDERKPYSDKEKLDYLSKKFPDLKGAIETLHLRLP